MTESIQYRTQDIHGERRFVTVSPASTDKELIDAIADEWPEYDFACAVVKGEGDFFGVDLQNGDTFDVDLV